VKKVIAEVMEEEKGKTDSKFEPMDGENKITRPSATKVVNAYIRVKGLQDPSSRQFIRPDAKLKKLLTPLNEDDQKKGGYSFFNLQRYMRHLYVKE
jgi:chromatin remodeling complex protein RSC6